MGSKRASGNRSGAAARRRVLLACVVGAVVLAGGGVVAGSFVKSPQQVAAETAPPPPRDLTAPVEERVLAQSLIIRGSVTAETSIAVRPAGAGGEKTARSVYTKVVPKEGDAVKAGTVLVEVSGRPVIALAGPIPAYRDLTQGDEGDDVGQFQRALSSLGYGLGQDRLGRFGPGTSAAVTRFYRDLGYSAPATTVAPGGPEAAGDPEGSGGREGVGDGEGDRGSAPAATPPATTVLVPAAEIVYVPRFPAHAERVHAEVGADVSDEAMTLSAGDLVVTGQADALEKQQIKRGQKVLISSSRTGTEAEGKVTAVGSRPLRGGDHEQGGTGEERFAVTVQPGTELDAEWAGQSVRLTVEAQSSRRAVLAVPSAAVSSRADGRTTVTVKHRDGTTRRVTVSVGMSADGYVQITPEEKGTVKKGDAVVVGTRAEMP
ncbi:peptidoglycan-binding protein [Streptomyces sp. CC210A]|uniref:peptidoglycan-binding protein n=1 Tax=Streptomyces sp. CC210A TaxID=2898184 RepID=UPI001F1ACA57|nr:peptidoglycan-binding protein [Streptomyces sp. CC210A]